jgi:hypothetical protein
MLSPMIVTVSLATLGAMIIFGMLVQKEFSEADTPPARFRVLGQVIFIGISPLLIAALLVLIKNMAQMVR